MTQWLFCFCFFFRIKCAVLCSFAPRFCESSRRRYHSRSYSNRYLGFSPIFFSCSLTHQRTRVVSFAPGFLWTSGVLMNFASSAHKVYRVISGSPHQRRAAPIVANVATLGGVGGVGHLFHETPLSRRPFKRPEQTNSARRV